MVIYDPITLKSFFTEVLVSVLANLGMVNSGMVVGFPSAVVPPLLGSGPGLHVSVEQAAWVAGLTFVSAPIACLLSGPLIDQFGRRNGLILLNIPFAIGWLLLALFPNSLLSLYLGRLLTGLGLGLASCVAITYTTEVTSPRLRTALVTLPPLMMAVGTFLVYLWALIDQKSWTEASYFGFALSIVSLVLTPLLMESPLWLLMKGHAEEAQQSLQKLRGASNAEQVSKELDSIIERVREQQEPSSWHGTLRNLCQPQSYKPLVIMNAFFLFQQLSGVGIVIQFAVDFTRAAGVDAEAYCLSLCIALVRMISAVLTSLACSRYGRRRPTVSSGIVMTLSLMALAACSAHQPPKWMSGSLIILYVLSSSVGFSTLPWSMLGEVFPTKIRGVSSGMTVLMVYLESLLGARIYPCMVRTLGSAEVFLFFGMSGLIGTLFLYLYLPETHGKSLSEIEDYFKGRWSYG